MPASEPVLIVGGGIGGLATALALAVRGVASHVLERREAFSEAGAGIQLGPNATRVLRAIGATEHLAPFAGTPSAIVVHDASSTRPLASLPLGDWIAARHGAPYWVTHRRDLQTALLTAVSAQPLIVVTPGFDAALFDESGDGVRITSAEGRAISGPCVVIADGIRSRLRTSVAPSAQLQPAGIYAARAVLPAEAAPNAEWLRSTVVTMAPVGHVVHYPVRAGREVAVVVIVPSRDAADGWAAPIAWEALAPRLEAFPDQLRRVLAGAPEWRRWDLAKATGIDAIARGRAALIGDAAHPILPFLAQGGALAIEDAATIAACIADKPGDPVAALAAYARQRLMRQRQVVEASRRSGEIYHLSGVSRVARNAALRFAPSERFITRLDWLYGWRPPE